MKVRFGNYLLEQRTQYSKIRLYDTLSNEDITEKDPKLAKEIIELYEDQIKSSLSYFRIDGATLTGMKDIGRVADYVFIPEDITKIAEAAFTCGFMKGVGFLGPVREIKGFAFLNCSNLEYFEVPDTVETIGKSAFEECNKLKTVTLPSKLTKIEERTFLNSARFESIIIPDSVTQIGKEAFRGCISLKEVKLPSSLSEISENTFGACLSLKRIVFNDGLTKIGQRAFFDCQSLESINLPDSVTLIDRCAFESCKNLKSVRLPNNLKTLSYRAFCNCENLENVVLPDTIETMQEMIFDHANKIESINIPRDLYLIKNGSPFEDSKIKTLIFNYNLTDLRCTNGRMLNTDLVEESAVEKFVISNNVEIITPKAVKFGGFKIKEIDYNGTKEEFENFKKNNKKFFDLMPNLKEINIIDEEITKSITIENVER